MNELFAALRKSQFRSRFALSAADRDYVARKPYRTLVQHARDLVFSRLAPRSPHNDGRQTPMRGHPVFVAQHATATCCRKCLARWHGIAGNRPLSDDEVEYIVRVINRWLSAQSIRTREGDSRQQVLFRLDDP
jgi:hypothetical protein